MSGVPLTGAPPLDGVLVVSAEQAVSVLIQCEAAVATITGSIEAPVKPGITAAELVELIGRGLESTVS